MVRRGDDDYRAAEQVGAALARAGCAVMTGGYGGIMEAASKGANEVGGHVIGVTSGQIQALRPGDAANAWVIEHVHYTTLIDRMNHLIREAAGYVVMPGGVGTLNELVLAWEYMRVREIPVRPIIAYGERWQRVITAFNDDRYVPPHHQAMIAFANTPGEVTTILQQKGIVT